MVAAVRQRPTRRQLEVLRAYIASGSIAAAAHELEIAESTARQHLSGLYHRTGCVNVGQAAYLLGSGALERQVSRQPLRGPARNERHPGAPRRRRCC